MKRISILAFGGVFALTWGLTFTANSRAETPDQKCMVIIKSLFGPNAKLYTTAEKETEWFYWGRLEQIFAASSTEKIEKLFKDVKLDDIRAAYWNVLSGNASPELRAALKENPKLEMFIMDLKHFTDDFPNAFWGASENRSVDLEKLFKEIDARHGLDVARSRAATHTARGLEQFEDALLRRALGEYNGKNFKASGPKNLMQDLKRFIFPYHNRVKQVVEFDDSLRKQMETFYVIDDIVTGRGLQRAKDLGITEDERKALMVFLDDTPGDLEKVRGVIKKIFGQELDPAKPPKLEDVDIYGLYKKLKNVDVDRHTVSAQMKNESDLDTLEGVLNSARKRKGEAPRTPTDYADTELQVRHAERDRKIGETRDAYFGATGRDSDVSYTVERRHTREVPDGTDSQGRPKTRTETYYTDDTVTPSYENILTGSFDTGDRGVSGLDSIKRASAPMVRQETAYRQAIEELEEQANQFVKSYSTVLKNETKQKETLAELSTLRDQVGKFRSRGEDYASWSKDKITGQWGDDNVADFKARNGQMLERLSNMERHLPVLAEQTTRAQPSLLLQYNLPDRTAQMEALEKYMIRNYWIKTGIGVGAAAAGGTGYYYYDKKKEEDRLNGFTRSVNDFQN